MAVYVASSLSDGLSRVSGEIAACRGGRHPWPDIWPGMKHVPKGYKAVRYHTGVFQVYVTCPCCGAEMEYVQTRHGRDNYKITYPPNWVQFPRWTEVRKHHFVEIAAEQTASLLDSVAVDAPKEDDE